MAIRSTSYLSEHRKRRKKVRRYILGTIAVFALYFIFLGVVWLIAWSPIFHIQHVTVQGNNVIASDDIITLVQANPSGHHGLFDSLLGWNNILSWPSSLSSSQLDTIPQLASVSVHKDYFSRTITITAVERNPFGIWCFLLKGDELAGDSLTGTSTTANAGDTIGGGSCYWFDDNGVLFEKATDTEGNIIVVVHDYSQQAHGLNQEVLPDDFTPNFISVVNVLHESAIGIQEIDLNDLALEEVDVITTDGPKIYFSLRFPADDYVRILQSLISQGGFNKLQYIDCRTEDRVYYK